MAQITNFDRETFLIHALELKLWLFEVCIGSHSLVMFAKKILRAHGKNFMGARGTLTTLYQTLLIIIWVPACIVWLLYMHSDRLCGGLGPFFCLVCGLLEKK